MYQIERTLYAGITNENGYKLIEKGKVIRTGYSVQRITDGEILGLSYEMKDYEVESMFIEIEYDEDCTEEEKKLNNNAYQKNRTIIAGVYNEIGFDLCVNRENLYTGKKFIRIHDGQEMGNKLYLENMDYSYYKTKPRIDLPFYYIEVKDELPEENNY